MHNYNLLIEEVSPPRKEKEYNVPGACLLLRIRTTLSVEIGRPSEQTLERPDRNQNYKAVGVLVFRLF